MFNGLERDDRGETAVLEWQLLRIRQNKKRTVLNSSGVHENFWVYIYSYDCASPFLA
jgi:hypothetical protein